MTLPTYILGVDPGSTTGICALSYTGGRLQNVQALQCSEGVPQWLVGHMLGSAQPVDRLVLAVERFVVGPRAAKSSTPAAGAYTRDLIGALTAIAEVNGAYLLLRSAADVKPWATDRRLGACRMLTDATKGMPHARDAARHALVAAVRECGMPDPLARVTR